MCSYHSFKSFIFPMKTLYSFKIVFIFIPFTCFNVLYDHVVAIRIFYICYIVLYIIQIYILCVIIFVFCLFAFFFFFTFFLLFFLLFCVYFCGLCSVESFVCLTAPPSVPAYALALCVPNLHYKIKK